MMRSTSIPDAAASAPVIADRSRRPTDPGPGEHETDRNEHDHRDRHRDVGVRRQVERAGRSLHDSRDRQHLAAEEVLVDVLERQRESDRDDHLLGQAEPAPSQRFPDQPVLDVSGCRTDDHGDDRRDDEVEAELDREHVRHESTEGDLLGVGEVGETGRSVDQRQADGCECEQQAEQQTLRELVPDLEAKGRRPVVDSRLPLRQPGDVEDGRLQLAERCGDGDRR